MAPIDRRFSLTRGRPGVAHECGGAGRTRQAEAPRPRAVEGPREASSVVSEAEQLEEVGREGADGRKELAQGTRKHGMTFHFVWVIHPVWGDFYFSRLLERLQVQCVNST